MKYVQTNLTYYDPRVCVIGLCREGLSLARLFSTRYKTIGFDPDPSRVWELISEHNATPQPGDQPLRKALGKRLSYTADLETIRPCNFYVVIVPPLSAGNQRYLERMSRIVGKVIGSGNFLVYESAAHPFLPESRYISIVEKESGRSYNKEFFVGYSSAHSTSVGKKRNGKIISASTPEIENIVEEVYACVMPESIRPVAAIREAEAVLWY